MTNRLINKVGVVTGSGSGIGKEIALALAREGAKVVTNNRSPKPSGEDAETTAKQIIAMGGQSVPFFGDVSIFQVAEDLMRTAVRSFGRLDILVNNAGSVIRNKVWEMSEDDYDNILGPHLKGSFNCIRHASPVMMEQKWGRILNCTSASWLGTPGACTYSAAKAGIVGLTKSVAMDVGAFGITCNAYHPLVRTRMTGLKEGEPPVLFKQRLQMGIISREEFEYSRHLPGPESVGSLVAYLSTDEATDINGQVFYVSGGYVAIYSGPEKKRLIFKGQKEGVWTVDELMQEVPRILLEGYRKPY